jgi:DNA-binding transcriptional MerR regulator
LRTYTLKEVSKKINVPTSTLKQWEKDLSSVLLIPRSKQGARIYSDHEIDVLLEIKHCEDNDLGEEEIRERLQLQKYPNGTKNSFFWSWINISKPF